MYKLIATIVISCFTIISFGQHPNNLQSNNITSSSVDLSWDDSPCSGATWVRYRETGTTTWIPASLPYNSIYDGDTTITGLQSATSYQWRVKCAGVGGWSNIEGFTTLAGCNFTTNISINNALCDNVNNGSAYITVFNGSPPYTYLWSNNSTDSSINNVASGIYTVTTTDAVGCFKTDTVFIGADNNINLSQSISPFIDTTNPNFPNTVQAYNVWVWDTLRLFNYGCDVNVRPEFTIYHENSPIQPGDIQIRWKSPFGYVIIPYNINNNGQAYGYWSTASNDSTGIIANMFSTNEILLKVRFINPAPYGKYTAIWDTKQVDGSGNIIQSVTDRDTAILTLVDCNNLLVDNTSTLHVNCPGDSTGSLTINSIINGSGDYSYNWINDSTPTSIISTNQSVQNLPAGNYSCIVSDNSWGCSLIQNFIINAPEPITVIENINNVSCYAENDGNASLFIIGGTSPYSYGWNGYNADSLEAGSYTYNIIDSIGCTYSDSILILQPDPIVSGLTYNNISNCISNNGTINLSPTGGPGNYYFSWSNGATSENIENLAAGFYSVVISSDTNNNQQTCSIIDSVEIQNYTSNISTNITSPNINGYNISCFGGDDGIIFSSTSNHVGPLSYLWSNGDNSQNINNVQAGYYLLTVTDSLGCIDSAEITLIEPNDMLEVTYSSTNISCVGIDDGSASIIISGGITGNFTGDTNYILNFQGNTNIIINPDTSFFTPTNLTAGIYPFSITDLAGCDFYDTINILGANALSLNLVTDTICCNGGTNGNISAQLSGGTGPFTYNWIGPNGSISTNNSFINGIGTGNYSLTVTDSNNCIIQNSIFVNENPPLSTSISNINNVSCLGGNDGSLSLNVNGGTGNYNYSWSNSNGTIIGNNSSLNNLFADTYTCTINSVGCVGCPESISVIISEPNTPLTTNYNQDNITCYGNNDGFATINFSGGNTGLNNGDTSYILIFDGNINTIIYPNSTYLESNLSAGNYTYSITDNNGCTVFDVINIIEPNPLSINFNYDTICCNGTNTGNIQPIINGGIPNYIYDWTGPNGFTSNDSSLTSISAGPYYLSITDQNGCVLIDSITLNQNPDLIVTVDSIKNINCKGDNSGYVNIQAFGGDGIYSFQWYNNSGIIPGGTSPSINNLLAGDYFCIVSDNCGCKDSIFITITEPPNILSSTYTQTNVSCYGEADGGATVHFFGGTIGNNPGEINYILGWEGNTYTLLNPIDSFVTPVDVPPGIYPYSATDINGCVTYDTITITEPDSLDFTYITGNGTITNGYDIDCYGNATQLNITAIGGTSPYNFSLNNSTYSPDPISFIFNPVFSGNQNISIVDYRGCTFDTIINLSEPSELITNLNTSNTTCSNSCDGQIISFSQGGVSPYYFVWSDLQNSTNDTNFIPIDSNLCAGNYTLTVIDQNDCLNNLSTTIHAPNPIGVTTDSIVNVVTYGGNDGAIYITPNGGTGVLNINWSSSNGFNSNTTNINNLYPGIYELEITDSNSCVYNEIFEIYQPSSLWLFTDSIQNTTCNGSCDGKVNITANGGDSTYTYSWLGPNGFTSNDEDINSLCAGQYILTLDDSITILIDTFNIYEPQPITINLSANSILCHNGQAQAQLNVWGGTQPYSYNWSNGDTNYYTTLNSGMHSCIISDANDCEINENLFISNPDSITVQANTTNPYCHAENSGQININITNGGTPPFNYHINTNPPQASNTFIGLSQGNYNFTITDSNGCLGSTTANLTDPPPLSSITSSTDVSCYDLCDGFGNAIATGGTPPYTYLWDNGNSNLCAGLHNVIITDNNGCINTNSIIVNEPNPLLINIWYSNNNLHATSGFSTYQWHNNNTAIPGAEDSIITPTAAGDYYVVVSDTNGCYAESYIINYSLSLNENNYLEAKIYPNPTENNIIITSKYPIKSIVLFNSIGNQLYSVNNNNSRTKEIMIDLSKFARGIYLIKMEIDNQIVNERIILQ